MSTDRLVQVKRRAWRGILLWLLPSAAGALGFALELRPTPHWVWDAAFLLLAILPLCAALLHWIRLRADLGVGLERVPCHVVRVDEAFPSIPQLEVEIRTGRLLLRDLRAERVVADYEAVYELTYARHLGWALGLDARTEGLPHESVN